MNMLGLSIGAVLISSACIAVLFIGLPVYHVLVRETNIERLEKFLLSQRNNPAHLLFYAIANRQDQEVERLVGELLIKYKQRHRQALYRTLHGLYRKDVAAVKDEISSIQPPAFRYYYEAYVHLEEGQQELARASIARVSKPWMKSSLLAELELKAGNRKEAAALARQAVLACKGVQRYVVYKHYERELPEAVAGL
ncbi:hypothetical protein [Paenibacillus sp. y28]|uniref:hypothetical protein n=1 Tax=Paenibacillus sp. y28 TaxID=3129110 RepID=UPI00301A1CE9